MKVLGLDQATTTGYAVSDDTGNILLSGYFKSEGKTHGSKFASFSRWLERLIDEQRIDYIAYEIPHLRGFSASEVCVGIVSQIHRIAAEHGLELYSVPTGTLKLFATGYGGVDKTLKNKKQPMIDAACAVTGKVIKDDNEADAIHIARWAVQEITGVSYAAPAKPSRTRRKRVNK